MKDLISNLEAFDGVEVEHTSTNYSNTAIKQQVGELGVKNIVRGDLNSFVDDVESMLLKEENMDRIISGVFND